MNNNGSKKLLEIIKNKERVTPSQLVDFLHISKQAVHRQLKGLVEKGKIIKIGKAPKVYYVLIEEKKAPALIESKINSKTKKIINQNYLIITPSGEMKKGIEGFAYWCQKNNSEIAKTAEEYVGTLEKYDKFKSKNLINGLGKIKATFKKVNVTELYYLDFYSIERFGKTQLGQLLLYSKQSQNKELIRELVEAIKPKIISLIRAKKIDVVAFVPPTVKREIQFMKELEKDLNLHVGLARIVKIKTPVIVPQKTLNKLEDRIENAKKTFIFDEKKEFKNLLIIDDAVGSGATINEIAGKIRETGSVKNKIIGLAITGSFKGFDVISEV